MIDSLCLSADIGAPPSALPGISLQHTHPHTHTGPPHPPHTHNSPSPFFLDLVIDVPDVSHHGVGASLQAPGGQGQLGAELLHVSGLGDGCQSVGASAKQDVTEGSLGGGHVR